MQAMTLKRKFENKGSQMGHTKKIFQKQTSESVIKVKQNKQNN
jgi:hypothetical protein